MLSNAAICHYSARGKVVILFKLSEPDQGVAK